MDDALNIVTVPAQGWQLAIVQGSGMLALVTGGQMQPRVSEVEVVEGELCLPAAHPAVRSAGSGGSELLECRESED